MPEIGQFNGGVMTKCGNGGYCVTYIRRRATVLGGSSGYRDGGYNLI